MMCLPFMVTPEEIDKALGLILATRCTNITWEQWQLKSVVQQLRQQQALQQLGMIPHYTWRLQRGFPERSLLILHAWLFEYFLLPRMTRTR
ncbi:hypothetical protein MKW98_006766 [Papaver atlanticum]|uniref:Uncharacterized protein n=1 Tax=Papaver atlanticum TaxID=357466 RepID=A0AAD4T2Z3_9MAGN|nr:hypothetical protein MKW98_006766 [Papaver atlanticum]